MFCPMGFAHDMWWGTYVKCMLCPCIFMFVLRSCSPFGWTAGRISILSIFRRRSPSPSMVRKAFATTTDLLPSTTTSTSLRDDDRSVPGVYFSILRVMANTIRRFLLGEPTGTSSNYPSTSRSSQISSGLRGDARACYRHHQARRSSTRHSNEQY